MKYTLKQFERAKNFFQTGGSASRQKKSFLLPDINPTYSKNDRNLFLKEKILLI